MKAYNIWDKKPIKINKGSIIIIIIIIHPKQFQISRDIPYGLVKINASYKTASHNDGSTTTFRNVIHSKLACTTNLCFQFRFTVFGMWKCIARRWDPTFRRNLLTRNLWEYWPSIPHGVTLQKPVKSKLKAARSVNFTYVQLKRVNDKKCPVKNPKTFEQHYERNEDTRVLHRNK